MDDLDEPLILIASHLTGKTRLDKWLCTKLPACSRSQVQKLILQGGVRLNDHPCQGKDLLAEGDMVTVSYQPSQTSDQSLLPLAIPLAVLYEDEHVIVINKPAGISVHPGAGPVKPTICAALLGHFADQGLHLPVNELGGSLKRPFIVHRLDRDTTGAMVCAKSVLAYQSLKEQFAQKTNTRVYRAVLAGVLPQLSLIQESYLGRDPRQRLRFASFASQGASSSKLRYAKSQFTTTAIFGHELSEVTVKLFTGRTHQIRVHSKDLRAPVLGDPLYGDPQRQWPKTLSPSLKSLLTRIKRQMLHAEILGFRHPESEKSMTFTAPIPEDFANLLQSLTPYQIGLKTED